MLFSISLVITHVWLWWLAVLITRYILSLADRFCPIYIQLYHICASDADNLFIGYSTRVSTDNLFYIVSKLPVIMFVLMMLVCHFFCNAETSNMSSGHLTILLSPREVCPALICNRCVQWPPACIIILEVSSQHAKLFQI